MTTTPIPSRWKITLASSSFVSSVSSDGTLDGSAAAMTDAEQWVHSFASSPVTADDVLTLEVWHDRTGETIFRYASTPAAVLDEIWFMREAIADARADADW